MAAPGRSGRATHQPGPRGSRHIDASGCRLRTSAGDLRRVISHLLTRRSGDVAGVDLSQHLSYGGRLAERSGSLPSRHGPGRPPVDLFWCRPESFDQLMGQMTHEPDRVRTGVLTTARRTGPAAPVGPASRTVRRGPAPRRRSAGSTATTSPRWCSRHWRPPESPSVPVRPLLPGRAAHGRQLPPGRPIWADPAPVGLRFRLAGTAQPPMPPPRWPAGSWPHPSPVGAGACTAVWAVRPWVLPSLLRALLGEDVQDQLGPVDDLDLHLLQLTQLAGVARRRRSRCPRRARTSSASSQALPEPTYVPASGVERRWMGHQHHRSRAVSARRAVLPSTGRPAPPPRRPDPDQHHPFPGRTCRYSTSLMSVGSVDSPATRRSASRSSTWRLPSVGAGQVTGVPAAVGIDVPVGDEHRGLGEGGRP